MNFLQHNWPMFLFFAFVAGGLVLYFKMRKPSVPSIPQGLRPDQIPPEPDVVVDGDTYVTTDTTDTTGQ